MKKMLTIMEDVIMVIISGILLGAGCDLMVNDQIFNWHYDILTGSVWGVIIVFGALVDAYLWGKEFRDDVNNLQERA